MSLKQLVSALTCWTQPETFLFGKPICICQHSSELQADQEAPSILTSLELLFPFCKKCTEASKGGANGQCEMSERAKWTESIDSKVLPVCTAFLRARDRASMWLSSKSCHQEHWHAGSCAWPLKSCMSQRKLCASKRLHVELKIKRLLITLTWRAGLCFPPFTPEGQKHCPSEVLFQCCFVIFFPTKWGWVRYGTSTDFLKIFLTIKKSVLNILKVPGSALYTFFPTF